MAQFLIKSSSRSFSQKIEGKGRFIFRVFIATCLCVVIFFGMLVNNHMDNYMVHGGQKSIVHVVYNNETLKDNFKKEKVKNLLDGCYHVYIDVGTNVGIQIRKLFEPEKYPEANVHQVFDITFGNSTERLQKTIDGGNMICAIGFEPNSHHTKQLSKIELKYRQCGWRVIIFTEAAASDKNGIGKFYTDESYANMEWGGGVLPPNINNIAQEKQKSNTAPEFKEVTLIRLSEFLSDVVGTRKIPTPINSSIPPQVVMKMDIEGSEVDVIPDMLFTGGFQYVNTLMVEWHERLERLEERKSAQNQLQSIVRTLSEYSDTMKDSGAKFSFKEMDIDDETYYTSDFDFPSCIPTY